MLAAIANEHSEVGPFDDLATTTTGAITTTGIIISIGDGQVCGENKSGTSRGA
jgi:hypothetical protein